MLINKSKSQVTIKKLIYDNKCYTDKASITHQLNNSYLNIGRKLADKLPWTDMDPTHYITSSFQKSFMFRGIWTQEVYDAITNINMKTIFYWYSTAVYKACKKLHFLSALIYI